MSPIYYIDRIIIKRVPCDYLSNIPYEIRLSDSFTQKFNSVCTILAGQLYDCSFYREPGDVGRKLKIIVKTQNGIVESNVLILPPASQDQNFAFEIRTKGNKQIYLVEVPFRS